MKEKKIMSKKTSLKIEKRNMELRNELWPDVSDEMIWNRKKNDGYTTIPRTLSYFALIMNYLSPGKPVSVTYTTLWCHVFDNGMVKITNPRMFALESGFTGERAERTWKDRMKILIDLGFILTEPGPSGEYSYVLIFNPYDVTEELLKKHSEIPRDLVNSFKQRMSDIGAKPTT
jgi:hypothetical protein